MKSTGKEAENETYLEGVGVFKKEVLYGKISFTQVKET
jgi:hypothetical protein